MNKKISILLTTGLSLMSLLASYQALAVGAGRDFMSDEVVIPAANNVVDTNSLDFTYHACVDLQDDLLREVGYLYISSYQDVDSVVDSQINYIGGNGYHMYAKYTYGAQFVGSQNTPSGTRANYVVNANNASFTLYLDPDQDTVIGLNNNCQVSSINTNDDIVLGFSNSVAVGEKSETNGLAQGDFKVIYNNWQFTSDMQNPILLNPLVEYDTLIFNGNITRLQGPLNADHRPEGSGNLFWR